MNMKRCAKCDSLKQLTELKSAFLSVFLGDTPTKQVPLPLVDLAPVSATIWNQTTRDEVDGLVKAFIVNRLEMGDFKIEARTLFSAFRECNPTPDISITAFGKALTRIRATQHTNIQKHKTNGHVFYHGFRLKKVGDGSAELS